VTHVRQLDVPSWNAFQVMDSSEKKAQLLKTLVMVTTGACARYTDPAILMEILFIVKGLIVDGSAGPSAYTLAFDSCAQIFHASRCVASSAD